MKELVCVAPDGSLEVWYLCTFFDINDNLGQTTWCSDNPETTIYLQKKQPEFWGREILGEL